ncbi:sensor histidine kinase [Desulfovulcanus sp.]
MWIFTRKNLLPWIFAEVGVLLLFVSTSLHLWSVYTQLKEHVYLDARQSLLFVELRFQSYEETLSLLENPPAYLKNPAWLVDELQSQPFLYGVLIWQKDQILLNSFPRALLPDKKVIELSQEGVEKNQIFYLSGQITRRDGSLTKVLVAIDTSFRTHLWQETLLHSLGILLAGVIIMFFLGFIFARFLKRQEKILRRLADAEKLAAAGRFSAMLAHEVRNPLNSLSMGLQYLKELGQPKPELLARMQKEVKKLDELIYELLEVAKGIDVRSIEVQASRVLSELENEFSPLAQAKKIHFELLLDKDFSFQADFRWLMRALSNLVRNALEAVQEKGWVQVKIWREKEEVGKLEKVCFLISDNGPGMAKEQIADIKRPFYTTKKQGFGIGLYLADMVAKAHKGALVIESRSGRGTRIILMLNV